jgi:hypothetical protein
MLDTRTIQIGVEFDKYGIPAGSVSIKLQILFNYLFIYLSPLWDGI